MSFSLTKKNINNNTYIFLYLVLVVLVLVFSIYILKDKNCRWFFSVIWIVLFWRIPLVSGSLNVEQNPFYSSLCHIFDPMFFHLPHVLTIICNIYEVEVISICQEKKEIFTVKLIFKLIILAHVWESINDIRDCCIQVSLLFSF